MDLVSKPIIGNWSCALTWILLFASFDNCSWHLLLHCWRPDAIAKGYLICIPFCQFYAPVVGRSRSFHFQHGKIKMHFFRPKIANSRCDVIVSGWLVSRALRLVLLGTARSAGNAAVPILQGPLKALILQTTLGQSWGCRTAFYTQKTEANERQRQFQWIFPNEVS